MIDTNVLVSRLLLPHSVAARAVEKAMDIGQLLISEDTMEELAAVLSRSKFDRYVSIEIRQAFMRRIGHIADMTMVYRRIAACRDPKDDKFLELAINGEAGIIITGDADLLALDPFQETRIVTPTGFLSALEFA